MMMLLQMRLKKMLKEIESTFGVIHGETVMSSSSIHSSRMKFQIRLTPPNHSPQKQLFILMVRMGQIIAPKISCTMSAANWTQPVTTSPAGTNSSFVPNGERCNNLSSFFVSVTCRRRGFGSGRGDRPPARIRALPPHGASRRSAPQSAPADRRAKAPARPDRSNR